MGKAQIDVENFNRQSPREELFNAISHGLGAVLAIAGLPVLIVWAALHGDAMSVVCATLYGSSLILLYVFSTLYHSITNRSAKKVLQVFDHCSIFILILGTYIPVTLGLIRGALGWTLFGLNAAVAVVGIILNAVSVKKFHKFSLLLYLLAGWSVLPAVKPLLNVMPKPGVMLALVGGLFYTIGVYFYRREDKRYMHLIWHFFVFAGSLTQYFMVLFYCLNAPACGYQPAYCRFITQTELEDWLAGRRSEDNIYPDDELGIYLPDVHASELYLQEEQNDPVSTHSYMRMINSLVEIEIESYDLLFAAFLVLHEYGHWLHFRRCRKASLDYVLWLNRFMAPVESQREVLEMIPNSEPAKEELIAEHMTAYNAMPQELSANKYALKHLPALYKRLLRRTAKK